VRGPRHGPSGESWGGNLDQATAYFEAALACCRNAGYRPELAWTCCSDAVLLIERAVPVHGARVEPPVTDVLRHAQDARSRVLSLLDESLAISSERGMWPLRERVLLRRELLGA